MSDFTILSSEQYFDKPIDVIKKSGTKAALTDFAILLGACFDDNVFLDGYSSLDARTGWHWTKTDDGDNDACVVGYDGSMD